MIARAAWSVALILVLVGCFANPSPSSTQAPSASAPSLPPSFEASTSSASSSPSTQVTPAASTMPAGGGLVHYSGEGSGQGFEFDYPATWRVIEGYHEVMRHGPTVMAAVGVGNFDINCTGSFPGAVQCGDPVWTVPPDGAVLVYRLEGWPQGPVVPFPTPVVEPADQWVQIDGRTALFSQASDGTMTWSLLGTPEVIEGRFGNEVATTAPQEIQAVIDSWKWRAPHATPRPTAITTGAGPATYEWQKVGEAQAGVFPIWAPDSNHLLIDLQAANEFDQVGLLDRDGTPVGGMTGVNQPMWLNSNTAVAYEGDTTPTGTADERSQYHMVAGRSVSASDGTSTQADVPCCFAVPNGHGAIAILRLLPDQVQNLPRPRFVVWQDGVESAEHDGWPIAWDLAGDKLIVIHPTVPDRMEAPQGWMEVLSWPDLKSLFQDDPKNDVGDAEFDPTGGFASYTYVYEDSSKNWRMEFHVIDLSSGALATIAVQDDPSQMGGDYVWNDQRQLLVTTQSRSMLTYLPDGTQVDQQKFPYTPVLQTSADGSRVLSYRYDATSDNPTDFRVLQGSDWQPLTLPFDPSWRGVQLSPDGSQVFASTNTDMGVAGYLATIP